MFTLLNPSALLALLALTVPVAIHLWNRRPAREVAVGSLRWLTAGANRRLRNLKPEQLWLLLLRAALLGVLALALADPVWQQVLPPGRGQVLLSPELLGTAPFATLRPTVDSLRRRGYALRWLAAGFPRVSGAAWRADSLGQRDSARSVAPAETTAAPFRWARVQQAAGSFPGQPLYVVTSATLADVQGPHPPLAANITWQPLPGPSATTWLQGAAIRGDSLRLLVGQSTERQTTFRPTAVARPRPGGTVRAAGLPPLRFETVGTSSQLRPVAASANHAGKSLFPVTVRSGPLRIIVYSTAAYAPDARYLQAGLRAAAAGLPTALSLRVASSPPSQAAAPDWLFWLTDAPLPAAWRAAVRQGTRVWQEAPGPGVAGQARLANAAADELVVNVSRRGAAQPDVAAGHHPLWTDGLGRPVLSRQALGQGALYKLHTRLNPAWSELADSPALPAALLRLLQPEPTDEQTPAPAVQDRAFAAADRRALDPAQFVWARQPLAGTKLLVVKRAAVPAARVTDVRPWLVLAAGLLFAFERLLARRRESQALPSTS